VVGRVGRERGTMKSISHPKFTTLGLGKEFLTTEKDGNLLPSPESLKNAFNSCKVSTKEPVLSLMEIHCQLRCKVGRGGLISVY
jgi:hypothetical protein